MRLFNGYHVKTEQKSYAWLSLDSSKAAKVDAKSDIGLRSRGKKLELFVSSGNLFFNVDKKLGDDETMNIRSSNMTTGVRGTIGWAAAISVRHTRIGILEGSVEVKVTNPFSGFTKIAVVRAGEVADLYSTPQDVPGATPGTSTATDKPVVEKEKISLEDITGLVAKEISESPKILERVEEAIGDQIDLEQAVADADAKLAEEQKAQEEESKKVDEALKEQAQNEGKNVDPVFGDETDAGDADSGETDSSGGGSSGETDSSGGGSSGGGYVPEPTIYTGTCQLLIPKSMFYYMVLEGQEPSNDNNPNYNVYAVPAGTQIGYNLYFHEEFCTIPSSGLPTIGGAVATVTQETNGDWPLHFSGTLTVPNAQTATLTIGGYTSTTTLCNLTFPTEGISITGVSYKMNPNDPSSFDAISNDFGGRSVPTGATVTFTFALRAGYIASTNSTITATATPSTSLTRAQDGSNAYTFVASGDTAISFSGVEPSHDIYAVLSKSDPSLSDYDIMTFKRSLSEGESTSDSNIMEIMSWDWGVVGSEITTVIISENLYPIEDIHWFQYATNLTTIIGLSKVDVSGVTRMECLFLGCESLTSLDLRGWNTSNVMTMQGMFQLCSSLVTIYVTAPDIEAGTGFIVNDDILSGAMFADCTSLVGGAGTNYDEDNPYDATYARIDGGTSNPGYFTAAP